MNLKENQKILVYQTLKIKNKIKTIIKFINEKFS